MGLCSQAGLCPPAAPFRARPAGWWCSIGSAGSAVPWEALQRPALASGSVMQPLSELLWKTSGKMGTPQTCSLNCVRSAAPPPPRSTRLCFTLTVSTASPQMSDSRVWGRARPEGGRWRQSAGAAMLGRGSCEGAGRAPSLRLSPVLRDSIRHGCTQVLQS